MSDPLPRCELTDLPRLWCEHCLEAGFTMTPEEQRQRELWLDRAGEPPTLSAGPRDMRHWQPVPEPPKREPATEPSEPSHPEWSDGRRRRDVDAIQALHEIPDRAAEAAEVVDAPNPRGRAEKTGKRKKADPPAPVNLAAFDAVRHALEEIAGAVRAVSEDHPDVALPGPPTFATDCGWLLQHADLWQGDAFLCEFVADAALTAHRALTALLGVVSEPRYQCPTCSNPMRLQPGDYFLCDSGVHQHPGPVALEQQWRRRPRMTTPDIIATFADDMGAPLTDAQIRQWATRGKLPRAGKDHAGRSLWLPWDVMRCILPDVVSPLDEQWARQRTSA